MRDVDHDQLVVLGCLARGPHVERDHVLLAASDAQPLVAQIFAKEQRAAATGGGMGHVREERVDEEAGGTTVCVDAGRVDVDQEGVLFEHVAGERQVVAVLREEASLSVANLHHTVDLTRITRSGS